MCELLPSITVVGHIEDVILGIASLGTDLDGTAMFGEFEFLDDEYDDIGYSPASIHGAASDMPHASIWN